MQKRGLDAWEEFRNVVRACKNLIRKDKAHFELNLVREVKDSKKGFFKYDSSKMKTREI